MRLWSSQILTYLPRNQFIGQLRELIAIMHIWRDRGKTNHLIINKVMEYSKADLTTYFSNYSKCAEKKKIKIANKYYTEFINFSNTEIAVRYIPYGDWLETEEHLRIEMANLYEKYRGKGSNKITEREWQKLLDGYKAITNKEYKI